MFSTTKKAKINVVTTFYHVFRVLAGVTCKEYCELMSNQKVHFTLSTPPSFLDNRDRPSHFRMSEDRYRLVVLGSAKVGKTSIIRRYLYNEFSEKYKETIEDLHSREFRIQVLKD